MGEFVVETEQYKEGQKCKRCPRRDEHDHTVRTPVTLGQARDEKGNLVAAARHMRIRPRLRLRRRPNLVSADKPKICLQFLGGCGKRHHADVKRCTCGKRLRSIKFYRLGEKTAS